MDYLHTHRYCPVCGDQRVEGPNREVVVWEVTKDDLSVVVKEEGGQGRVSRDRPIFILLSDGMDQRAQVSGFGKGGL